MKRMPMFCGFVILGLAFLVGNGATQDKDKKEEKKIKGMLPPGFKDLGLSKEQVNKIYMIQTEYNGKIADLTAKLNELKKQKSAEEFKVLTEEQRDKYLKAKGVELKDKGVKDAPKDKVKDGDKKPVEKTADKKSAQ